MLLDIHLHEHVESLLQKIREKALVQYFSPFTSVDMQEMAKAFNTTAVGLEKELSKLIFEGLIQARIDSHNMVNTF
jgi:COP9 signalosome complex subunit 1